MTRTAMLQRERRPVPLHLITGRSPQNCRKAIVDDDRAGLVASMLALDAATGEPLIQPLIVSPVSGPLLKWHVHDGGRRWQALGDIVAAGAFKSDRLIDCMVLEGDDEAIAREVSLFANSLRRDLHPVEQCDAFEALRAAGVEAERIAQDFALPLRTVRQRLRLTRLSPAVRAAWRDGRMSTDQAQAFAANDSHEAQDELLERIDRTLAQHSPHNIRTEMLHAAKAQSFDTREALYVGVDAYVAAGGRIEEDLFADVPLMFDEALLKRLARETMMAAGEAILTAEGYCFCFAVADVDPGCRWWKRIAADYTAAEAARLDDPDLDPMVEAQAIETRGLMRLRPALRAAAGILVDISPDGRLVVDRGLLAPPPAKDAPAAAETPRREPEKAALPAKTPAKPPKPADPIEAAASGIGIVRAILDDTVGKALVAIVSARPDLALMFAVARFGGSYAPEQLEREFGIGPERFAGPSKRDGVLGRLDGKGFDVAVTLCADVPLADLTVAFAAIAARSIRLQRHAPLSGFAPVVSTFARRGAALGPAFRAAFDADRYFEAASKAACLAALDAMATPHVDRQAKKPVLAALAAGDAKAKGWLPFPLDGWAKLEADSPEAHDEPAAPAKPLAQAMGEAIDADEARQILELLVFLTIHLEESAGDFIASVDLYAAYRDVVNDPLGEGRFVDELFELGCLSSDGRSVGDVAFADETTP